VMFVVWLNKPGKIKEVGYASLSAALDHAKCEALYGDWLLVEIAYDHALLVTFNAEEMRHASQRERQTREFQVSSRVLPGL
jgi:hypothetical protein